MKEGEQFPDRSVAVERIAEGQVAVHFVSVATSLAGLREVAGMDEVVDDLGSRSLSQTNDHGDVSQTGRGVTGDCFEDAGMVRHEPPAMVAIGRDGRRASRARGVHVRGGHGELLRFISGT